MQESLPALCLQVKRHPSGKEAYYTSRISKVHNIQKKVHTHWNKIDHKCSRCQKDADLVCSVIRSSNQSIVFILDIIPVRYHQYNGANTPAIDLVRIKSKL